MANGFAKLRREIEQAAKEQAVIKNNAMYLREAAPDLLAALIGLLPENQPAHLNGEPSMAAVERARAAIAKATGQPYEQFDTNEQANEQQ